uniref:Dehydrogenase n=1 Tax=Glossina palpalis gambiensis TaxID=67801 RepID=A0A1B0AX72_9MUSC
MERWLNKVAVVTGASSGIGAATTKNLIEAGFQVIGLARRIDRLNELKSQLPFDKRQQLTVSHCDVSCTASVDGAFNEILQKFGGIDVLINNAGCLMGGQLCTMDIQDLEKILQTNVMGVVRCTQIAFKSMKERDVNGHIIMMNSINGHKVLTALPKLPMTNMYTPAKYALTAITDIYRQEFAALKTKIKITSISPGLVDTEMVHEKVRQKHANCMLDPDDVAHAILYALSTPMDVQVHEIMIRPLGEMF